MPDRLVEHPAPLRRPGHLVLAGAQDRERRERLVEVQRRPCRVDVRDGADVMLADEGKVVRQGKAKPLLTEICVRFLEPVPHRE